MLTVFYVLMFICMIHLSILTIQTMRSSIMKDCEK